MKYEHPWAGVWRRCIHKSMLTLLKFDKICRIDAVVSTDQLDLAPNRSGTRLYDTFRIWLLEAADQLVLANLSEGRTLLGQAA